MKAFKVFCTMKKFGEVKKDTSFEIYIKTLSGKTTILKNLHSYSTIDEIKIQYFEKEMTPVQQQRLMFNGNELKNGNTLADYNIVAFSTVHMVVRLSIGKFTSNGNNKNLVNFLMSSEEKRQKLQVPHQDLRKAFEEQKASLFLTYHFEKVPKKQILSKEQAEKLVNFLEYFWKLKTDEEVGDMKVVIQSKDLIKLLKAEKSKGEQVIKRLGEQFERFGEVKTERKIVLRVTKGPTAGAIQFHCDGYDATRTVQVALNSTENYSGGRLCFYVNEKLHVLNNRPVGSVVIHPRNLLHGVSKLTKGTRYSLFVIDECNGKNDPDFVVIDSNQIDCYLVSTC